MKLQLIVNNKIVDTDNNTAIGITYNGFDFSDSGKIHLTYSNSFTIPLTNKNRSVFGIVDNMGVNSNSVDSKLYDNFVCSLFVNGTKILNGKIYVNKVSDGRIEVFILNNKDFTETMQDFSMFDVTELLVNEINSDLNTSYPSGATFNNIIAWLASGSNDVWIPYTTGTLLKQYPYAKTDNDGGVTCGNLYEDTDNSNDKEQYNIDNETTITTEFVTDSKIVGDYKTGHIYINLYRILITVFNRFGFDIEFDNDIETDITKQFIRMPDVVLYKNLITGYYNFRADSIYKCKIGGEAGSVSKKLSFLDLFKMICNEYCLVFDITNNVVSFHSFNDIKNIVPGTYFNSVVNKRAFLIEGINKTNWIKYEKTGDGNEYAGALQIICSNKNVSNSDNELVSIKRFICGYLVYMYEGTNYINTETFSLNTSDTSVNESFVMVQKDNTQTPFDVKIRRYLNGIKTETTVKLYKAVQTVVNNSGWWDLFKNNCLYPEEIELEAYIKPFELLNFRSFNLATFKTMPGVWYISNINGWNPLLDNGTVKVTAIRIR